MKDETWDRSYKETRDGNTFDLSIKESDVVKDNFVVTIQINNIIISLHNYTKKSFPNVDNFYHREVGRIHTGYYDSYVNKKEK
jgi:hypothetical protein